ncbi:nucleolar protein 9 isoform X2 [Pectinophora gossypiella]|nr:nucleolar protein 9 isoform X2 [Pectinophora gossypiella]
MDTLLPELRRLSPDNFTSHIVETSLKVACDRATEHLQNQESENTEMEEEVPKKKRKKASKEGKYSEGHIKKCHEYSLNVSRFVLNNLEDFAWDPYANHILRSVLKSLSGITLLPGEKPKVNLLKETEKPKGIPPHLTKMDYKTVPDEFKEMVVEFAKRMSSWPQFKEMPFKNLTSGMLQVLLYAVKNCDKNLTRDLIKQLLNESLAPDDWVNNVDDEKKDVKGNEGDDDETVGDGDEKKKEVNTTNLPPVFKQESAVRLLEAALFVAKKKMYTQIYARCFINRLGQLATMPMLNFTVQRLIDNCQIKEEFEPMFDELADKFPALLSCGNTGVLLALGKACLRVQARQAQLVQKLESAFNCTDPSQQKYFSVCCLRLLPLNRIDVSKLVSDYFIHIHGSVILQTILDFQRPAKAVNSLLELAPEELVVIFSDAKGCHVADALCRGQCVGVKARDKLVWRLKGYYQKLALSQYGSRAFEQIFETCSPEQRVKIMTEISDKSNLLNSTQYGRVIATKLDVATFKQSQKQWEETWKNKKNKE